MDVVEPFLNLEEKRVYLQVGWLEGLDFVFEVGGSVSDSDAFNGAALVGAEEA